MNYPKITIYLIYLIVVSLGCILISRSIIAQASLDSIANHEQAQLMHQQCEKESVLLHSELWQWYIHDIQILGPYHLQREPLPTPLKEWEMKRKILEKQCAQQVKYLEALARMRREFESNAYVLSQRIGREIAYTRP